MYGIPIITENYTNGDTKLVHLIILLNNPQILFFYIDLITTMTSPVLVLIFHFLDFDFVADILKIFSDSLELLNCLFYVLRSIGGLLVIAIVTFFWVYFLQAAPILALVAGSVFFFCFLSFFQFFNGFLKIRELWF